jgi:hypothetical protein
MSILLLAAAAVLAGARSFTAIDEWRPHMGTSVGLVEVVRQAGEQV